MDVTSLNRSAVPRLNGGLLCGLAPEKLARLSIASVPVSTEFKAEHPNGGNSIIPRLREINILDRSMRCGPNNLVFLHRTLIRGSIYVQPM
jgi:hypothetical protein